MKKIKVQMNGITPLIMHSCKAANPLHPIAKEMKKYTSRNKKTDEDYEKLSDLEWESGLYWNDDCGGLYIPGENFEAMLRVAARNFKKGKDVEKYVIVEEAYVPMTIRDGRKTFDELLNDYAYRDVRQMVVNRSRITRTRPRFNQWGCVFTIQYDEKFIDIDVIVQALEYGGQYVGMCDSRPRYGKFAVVITECEEVRA